MTQSTEGKLTCVCGAGERAGQPWLKRHGGWQRCQRVGG